MAANRGPVSFHSDPSGEPVVTRGAGGLVTVLCAMLARHPGVWIAAAASDEEEKLAAAANSLRVDLDGETYQVRYVAPEREAYHLYYNVAANPMLWFIQHYLWDLARLPTSARTSSTPGTRATCRSTACSPKRSSTSSATTAAAGS